MIVILGLFLFAVALGLFGLAIIGAILILVLRIFAAVLRLIIKLTERRIEEPEIIIVIEQDEPPVMRDVTRDPRRSTGHGRVRNGGVCEATGPFAICRAVRAR